MKIRTPGLTFAAALVLALAAPLSTALAVQPDEILADPTLEARARALSAELRCLVCQNQSIDDSDAPLVRERLQAGDNDGDVRAFIVARYGDFVLLRPPFAADTLLLWLAPVALMLAAMGIAYRHWSRARAAASAPPLSAAEEERLARALAEDRDRGEAQT